MQAESTSQDVGSPTEAQWAWLAGIFEGEGCIVIQRSVSVRVVIGMTDRDVIERVHSLVPAPGGIKTRLRAASGRKPIHNWILCGRERIERFLRGILPWLGARRLARAREALDYIAAMPGTGHMHRDKTHCPQGHAYSGANLYVTQKGYRSCRACKREWVRRKRAENEQGSGGQAPLG